MEPLFVPGRTTFQAAYEGDLRAVQTAIEEHKFDVTAVDSDGRTVLHWAAAGGHLELVNFLLRQPGVSVNTADKADWTPLMSAASAGASQVVLLLLTEGADANKVNSTGRTALHYHKGNTRVVEALLTRVSKVDAVDELGMTALARAAASNQPAAIRQLSAAGASLSVVDKYGNTPLHTACANDAVEAAAALIELGASTTASNNSGKTPRQLFSHESLAARVVEAVQAQASV